MFFVIKSLRKLWMFSVVVIYCVVFSMTACVV